MKKILFICVLLLSMLSVMAVPTIYGSSQAIYMNSCTVYSESFTLHNSDINGHPYTLSVDSSVSPWVTFSDKSVFIGPGDSKEITYFIRPPCGESGTFDLPIIVESEENVVTYERELIVSNDPNLQVQVDTTKIESCPCNGQLISFDVSNIGTYPESYSIKVSKYNEQVRLNPSNMFLGPGMTQSGNIFVAFACDTYGDKEFDLIVTAQNSDYEAVIPISYKINACSEFNVQTPQFVDICQYQEKAINVSVFNDAQFSNDYTFKTKGSFSHGDYDISLASQTPVNVQVLFSPEKFSLGNHTTTIEVKEEFANYKVEKDIFVQVRDCYDLSISQTQTDLAICHEDETVNLEIINDGLYNEEIHLNLDGPNFVQLNDSQVFVQNNSSVQIPVTIDGKNISESDKGEFTITAVQKSAQKVYDDITFKFVKDSYSDCYGLELLNDDFDINSSTTNVSIGLTSVGSKEKSYTIGYSGSQWMSIPLNNMTITPGQTSVIPLNIDLNESVLNGSYEVFVIAETENYIQVMPLMIHYNSESKWMVYVLFITLFFLFLALLFLFLLLMFSGKKHSKDSHVLQKSEKNIPAPNKTNKTNKTNKKDKKSIRQKKEELSDEDKTKNKRTNWLLFILLLFLLFILLLFILIGVVLLITQTTDSTQSINETNNSLTQPGEIDTGSDQINGELVQNQTNSSINQSEKNDGNSGGFFSWLASFFRTDTDEGINQNQTNVSTNQTYTESQSVWDKITSWFSELFSTTQSQDVIFNDTTVIGENDSIIVPLNQTDYNQTNMTNMTNVTNVTDNITNITNINQNGSMLTSREVSLQEITQFIDDNNITGETQTVLFITQNSSRVINLDNYFVDPDGDNLTYTVYEKNASEVALELNDSFVTITPASDYIGLTQTYFTATDSDDVGAVSPEITLIVRPVEPRNDYMTYFVLIVIFVIIFIIVIYFDVRLMRSRIEKNQTKQKKREKTKTTRKKPKKKSSKTTKK